MCCGMDCFGTYLTHAQTCDNVRVQSATERTALVHFLFCWLRSTVWLELHAIISSIQKWWNSVIGPPKQILNVFVLLFDFDVSAAVCFCCFWFLAHWGNRKLQIEQGSHKKSEMSTAAAARRAAPLAEPQDKSPTVSVRLTVSLNFSSRPLSGYGPPRNGIVPGPRIRKIHLPTITFQSFCC